MKLLVDFLKDLKKNNNKEWFNDNRKRYEASKEQMLFLTELMAQEIRKIDSEIPMLNPKDCLFRIFRDVRFSKDKTPYKTNMGCFITRDGRKSHRAGYYIHIDSEASFLGGGIWCPQAAPLKAIRSEIFENASAFKEIIQSKRFNKYYQNIEGEKLKTAPKGFPKDFENIDLLRYKSYAFSYPISDEVVLGADFVNQAVGAFRELYQVNRYLNSSLDKWM